jgi:hypothetical protein
MVEEMGGRGWGSLSRGREHCVKKLVIFWSLPGGPMTCLRSRGNRQFTLSPQRFSFKLPLIHFRAVHQSTPTIHPSKFFHLQHLPILTL